MDIKTKLNLLRHEMRVNRVDAYIIPSTDAHNSEYVPSCWERRAWISGFDGSAGEVLVTLDNAYLWTDGRYFSQAELQLDQSCYQLMKQSGYASEVEIWIANNAKDKVIAIDPSLFSITRVKKLEDIVKNNNGKLLLIPNNLIDQVKVSQNILIDLPNFPIKILSNEYTGCDIKLKVEFVRDFLKELCAEYFVFNVLDEIAWLFNLRGADIEFNPLAICYAIVGIDKTYLFINENKLNKTVKEFLHNAGIEICSYDNFFKTLTKINGVVCLDDRTANYAMLETLLKNNVEVVFERSPIIMAKSCKNSVELDGIKHAHIKDAVAVINFLYWLEQNWRNGVDELSASEMLLEFRSKMHNFQGPSFATISGFAENGAVIHYRATPKTNKLITDDNIYLLDSGGQYLEGTTDITRTLHLGNPTNQQKRHYTLVLKGHLALARAVFPAGTCGEHLDVLARSYLWNEFLNYRHGTGHGVGHFLCVHEGPQRISGAPSGVALQAGMILSNEPGVYFDGEYGIRIENLVFVNQILSEAALNSDYGTFYKFDDLTLVPYSKRLIDFNMLDEVELSQLKSYYNKIKLSVGNLIDADVKYWLECETQI